MEKIKKMMSVTSFRLKLKNENSVATLKNNNLIVPPTSNIITSKHILTINPSPTID